MRLFEGKIEVRGVCLCSAPVAASTCNLLCTGPRHIAGRFGRLLAAGCPSPRMNECAL